MGQILVILIDHEYLIFKTCYKIVRHDQTSDPGQHLLQPFILLSAAYLQGDRISHYRSEPQIQL